MKCLYCYIALKVCASGIDSAAFTGDCLPENVLEAVSAHFQCIKLNSDHVQSVAETAV